MAALGLCTLALLTAIVPARATSSAATCDPGPIGWDTYRHTERLPLIRCGVESRQFSSFNRDGGNLDGQQRFACLRTDPVDGCVIAEAKGAGEVDSIWFTRDRGNVTNNGTIRIDLDGERVLEAALQDVVDGKLGEPWVFPLVANSTQTSGGNYIKVPMPFRSSMRISIDDARYYHVTWRSVAEAGYVETFDPDEDASDVIALMQAAGSVDPKPAGADASSSEADMTIPAGGSLELPTPPGPGVIDELEVDLPDVRPLRPIPQVWEETPVLADAFRESFGYDYYPNYVPDTTSHALDGILSELRLRIAFDGATTVDAPLGEFFGAGIGEYDVPTLMFAMSTVEGDGYRSWWPMPYLEGAVVEIHNSGDTPVSAHLTLDISNRPEITDALARGDAAYFHSSSTKKVTELDNDFVMLDEPGQGHVVGVTHTMWPGPYQNEQHIADGLIRTYLEGDERIYSDGSLTPQLHGTGNEDFYEGGWYFNRSVFANPLNGNPVHEQSEGCEVGCTGTYRLLLADAIVFGDGIHFGMEVGETNDEIRTFGSTTYWYGLAKPSLRPTDSLFVGEADELQSHDFSGTGAAQELTSSFEGDADTTESSRVLLSSSGPIDFTVTIDPDNRGVRIRRTSDQLNAGQAALVSVDGEPVGVWYQPLGNPYHRWLQDTFDIPTAYTTGRSQLAITLTPLDGMPEWSTAGYEVLSRIHTP